MTIIILVKTNPFFENVASANRLRTLIDGLTSLGASIELFITGGYNSLTEYNKLRNNGTCNGIKYKYMTMLFHHNIWLRRLNLYLLNPIMEWFIRWRILSILKTNELCIVWSSTELAHFKLVLWLKSHLPNNIYFLEMSEFLCIHQYNLGNRLQRMQGDRRQIFFEKKAIYAYDGIALMTKTLLAHFDSFPGKKPKFLHLPMTVDLDRFKNPDSHEIAENLQKPFIAFIGVMDNRKDGVDILIDAFAAILEDFPHHHLHLFGSWNYDTPGHLKQIKALRLEDKVIWHGAVQRDEVPSILLNADLLALPRPASKQAQGGFPTKLGEYLASSKPVCVTTVGEIPEYLQDGESAFFAEPGSSESFAHAMRRALSDRVNALRVGVNGRKVAEKHFNKDIQAKILYEFLQGLIRDDSK